jgi:hypothetical protein
MFNKKIWGVALALSLIVISIAELDTISIAAGKPDRYDTLSARNVGYKERAAQMGKTDVEEIKIQYPDNSNSEIALLPIEKMEGYTAALSDSAYYIFTKIMTYGELLNSDDSIDLDPSIDKNRMVWVANAQYPNNISISRGYIENANETRYWDAQTGKFIGATIRSLNKDGSINPEGIHCDRDNVKD